jgi:hypothetical protein
MERTRNARKEAGPRLHASPLETTLTAARGRTECRPGRCTSSSYGQARMMTVGGPTGGIWSGPACGPCECPGNSLHSKSGGPWADELGAQNTKTAAAAANAKTRRISTPLVAASNPPMTDLGNEKGNQARVARGSSPQQRPGFHFSARSDTRARHWTSSRPLVLSEVAAGAPGRRKARLPRSSMPARPPPGKPPARPLSAGATTRTSARG